MTPILSPLTKAVLITGIFLSIGADHVVAAGVSSTAKYQYDEIAVDRCDDFFGRPTFISCQEVIKQLPFLRNRRAATLLRRFYINEADTHRNTPKVKMPIEKVFGDCVLLISTAEQIEGDEHARFDYTTTLQFDDSTMQAMQNTANVLNAHCVGGPPGVGGMMKAGNNQRLFLQLYATDSEFAQAQKAVPGDAFRLHSKIGSLLNMAEGIADEFKQLQIGSFCQDTSTVRDTTQGADHLLLQK
ncbi:MAG: hypothetical protein M1827_006937 [Pycnora praestabilis]|nr:MAG: hypothetical protein M1827_006937 [Pycnora praestabilis]